MFIKLLKYDLRYIYKILGVYYIATIACALIGKLLTGNSSSLLDFAGVFLSNASIGLCIGMIINAITRTWVRFQHNIYGDESYLTHTLPVSRQALFSSKFISSLITLLLSFALALLVAFLLFRDNIDLSFLSGSSIAIFITAIFVQFFMIIQCGFSGILIGHRAHNRRALWSMLAGVAIYVVLELILLGGILLWGQFYQPLGELIANGHQPTLSNTNVLLVGISVMYIIEIVALYFINIWLLKRGVDVE